MHHEDDDDNDDEKTGEPINHAVEKFRAVVFALMPGNGDGAGALGEMHFGSSKLAMRSACSEIFLSASFSGWAMAAWSAASRALAAVCQRFRK